MNGDNRRQHPRSEIDHPAKLYYHDTTLPDCHIKNFSLGGIYLENSGCDFPTLVATAVPRPGGPGIKHALVEIPNAAEPDGFFSVAVKICFVSPVGLGVAFMQTNPALLRYFSNLRSAADSRQKAHSNGAADKPAAPIDPMIRGRIDVACKRFLNRRLPEFFSLCEARLPEAADHAPSDTLRTDLLHAQQKLQREAETITTAQISHIGKRVAQLLDPATRDHSTGGQVSISREMELVAKDEFEEWVVIVGLGHAVEADITAQLHQLELGLSCLLKRPINNDTNPLSPTFLLWTLCNSLLSVDIGFPVRRTLYDLFKEAVLTHIAELYGELWNIFERHGVDTKVVSIKACQTRVSGAHTGARPSRPQTKRSLVGTLSSLLSSSGKTGNTPEIPGRPSASRSEIHDAISGLNSRSARSLTDQIARSLADNRAKNLDRDSQETIAAIEQLVASLKQEQQFGEGLQQLLEAVKLPVVCEALDDPSLLEDSGHPATELFKRIDQLAPYVDSLDAANQEPLLQIIDQLASASPDQNRAQLREATKKIEALLISRREAFDHNLANVVASNRQNDNSGIARQRVLEQLASRLEGVSAANLIPRLLRCGWPGLLHKHAAAGDDGEKRFQAYLGVIDYLLKLFPPDCQPGTLDQQRLDRLLALLGRGFDDYPVHASQAHELLEEIGAGLQTGGEACRKLIEPRVQIDAALLHEILDQQVASDADDDAQPLSDSVWGSRIRALATGDWIVQQRDNGQVRLLNLAWYNNSSTRFVFVDGSGNQVLDNSAAELETMFTAGTFSLLESRELPIVDRAVERMMKNTFERVEQESRIDELTGLLNRHAFARRIEALHKRSLDDGSHHALLLLDIDQFSMVNDLCGYEGGDKLLKEISGIIATYQRDDAILARTGDDEFGILLQGSTVDRGYQAAETQRRALEAYRFAWEQKSVPISASIGIVAIDNTAGSAQGLLKDAASACDLAKNSGRNCSRVFQLSDEELQRKNRLIRSVPVIEEALANDRISLHGQLISPLFLGEGDDHYEVLLRLTDTNGKPSDPSDFITAAEQFDRMRTVDRWIIDTFFAWARRHSNEISTIEGFSLNISGQSIVDPTFRDFLRQHLVDGPFSPERIDFEVTETAVVKNMDQVNAFMREIRALGSKFYLDDFGSGYASYSYLKKLEVDCVKIDGIFVKDILTEKSSRAMVNSITEIAHHMDKKVIAEYAETEAHIIELRELGVDFAQGYGVGLPQPLSTILQAAVAYG